MHDPLIPLSDVRFALVQHEKPMKASQYLSAGAPTRCFLPSCRKPFDGSCYRGDDDRYYCAQACAKVGEEVEFAKAVKIREAG